MPSTFDNITPALVSTHIAAANVQFTRVVTSDVLGKLKKKKRLEKGKMKARKKQSRKRKKRG